MPLSGWTAPLSPVRGGLQAGETRDDKDEKTSEGIESLFLFHGRFLQLVLPSLGDSDAGGKIMPSRERLVDLFRYLVLASALLDARIVGDELRVLGSM